MNFQTELQYLMSEFQWIRGNIDLYESLYYLTPKEREVLDTMYLYEIHLQVSVHQLVNMNDSQ